MAIVGQGITAYPQPDDALNENSKNPVQNKVVAGNIKELKGKDTVQDERIAAMEQVTTATTIGPVAIATFDASAANMPLKGLTANIGPVQDLHGYDHPWPEGGGKNLLKYPYETGTVTKNGVTFTVYNDGSIKVDTAGAAATANADLYFFSSTGSLPLSNGDYIFSSTYDGTLPSDGFYIHAKANASDASYLNISIGDEGLYTVSNGVFYTACIRVLSGRTINNVTVRPMLRLATEADATFEPYSNICPISGWTGCNVNTNGKNFMQVTLATMKRINTSGVWTDNKYTHNSITFTVDTDDNGCVTAIAANGTASGEANINLNGIPSQLAPLPTNTTCRISGCPEGGSGNTYRLIAYLFHDGTYLNRMSQDVGNGTLFGSADANNYYARINIKSGVTASNLVFTPMLRLSTDSSTFEPYKGTTYPITFPTSAGTVYGGTLDVMSGKLSVEYASRTLPNADSIRDSTVAGTGKFVRYNMSRNTSVDDDTVNAIGEKLKGVNRSSTEYKAAWTMQTYFGNTNAYLSVFVPADYTLEQIDAAIAGSQIVYKLTTPIVYDLTDIPEITTLLGENNIWADACDVTVTYGAYLETVKKLVDKREMREEQVEGTVVNLNAEPNTRYICGEVATLDITLPASGICDIVFTSGSTPTVLTVPSTVKWMHGFDPTALAADTIYELNITDGLGVVASWT